MTRPVPLASLRTEVHRFTGVVDRFGSCPTKHDQAQTVCLRNLRQADNGQPLEPEHWWFQLREVWTQAGIRVGDTVLFTAKVQQATKGRHDPHQHHLGNPRRQVVGFASTPRSVVVLRRRQGYRHDLVTLEKALAQRDTHLSEALQEKEQLSLHYTSLLERQQELEQELHQRQDACNRLEQQYAESQQQRLLQRRQLRRRLIVTAALTFSVGGLSGAGLMAALQRSGPVSPQQASQVAEPPAR
jgi:hypothetical protein